MKTSKNKPIQVYRFENVYNEFLNLYICVVMSGTVMKTSIRAIIGANIYIAF